jgi:hypothetical protein
METKLFATSLEDARWWADQLYAGEEFRIITVMIPEGLFLRLHRNVADGRNAVGVYRELLAEFNAPINVELT